MSSNCIFCKIIDKQIPSHILYEDEYIICILDAFPANVGHCLVIPKLHVENIFSLENNLGSKLFSKSIDVACALKNTFNVNDINIMQNNGSLAGQTVEHFHIHIIPRFENDNFIVSSSKTYEPLKLSHSKFEDVCLSLKNSLSRINEVNNIDM